ncbi:GNAT family N-acetyltransferase [Streptomyces sp. NPDC049954]|uniref:GNAT family N-acetyltransferase n=1 Tax=Streptomyces sp. NPDC049954 TaxID=3155779 RepID=UPI00344A1EC2
MPHPAPDLQIHGPEDLPALVDTLVAVWTEAHSADPAVFAAGFTPEALRRQVGGHAGHDTFTLVTAHDEGGNCTGFAYGFLCTPEYWYGPDLLPAIPAGQRTATRLAGICEIAVRRAEQGRGTGTLLHDVLLERLRPEWASLLALPGSASQRFYDRLGYTRMGAYRPDDDSASLDLLACRVQERGDGSMGEKRISPSLRDGTETSSSD